MFVVGLRFARWTPVAGVGGGGEGVAGAAVVWAQRVEVVLREQARLTRDWQHTHDTPAGQHADGRARAPLAPAVGMGGGVVVIACSPFGPIWLGGGRDAGSIVWWSSLRDVVEQVGDRWGASQTIEFEVDGLGSDGVEQSGACADQDGGEVQGKLVDEPGRESLLGDTESTTDQYVLAVCGNLGLLDGAGDAVGDEGVAGAASLVDPVLRSVGEHEHRCVERGVVTPGFDPEVEHPAPDDLGTDPRVLLGPEVGVARQLRRLNTHPRTASCTVQKSVSDTPEAMPSSEVDMPTMTLLMVFSLMWAGDGPGGAG